MSRGFAHVLVDMKYDVHKLKLAIKDAEAIDEGPGYDCRPCSGAKFVRLTLLEHRSLDKVSAQSVEPFIFGKRQEGNGACCDSSSSSSSAMKDILTGDTIGSVGGHAFLVPPSADFTFSRVRSW